jgi:hypothetical protein
MIRLNLGDITKDLTHEQLLRLGYVAWVASKTAGYTNREIYSKSTAMLVLSTIPGTVELVAAI